MVALETIAQKVVQVLLAVIFALATIVLLEVKVEIMPDISP